MAQGYSNDSELLETLKWMEGIEERFAKKFAKKLLDKITKEDNKEDKNIRIFELGTGSGFISVPIIKGLIEVLSDKKNKCDFEKIIWTTIEKDKKHQENFKDYLKNEINCINGLTIEDTNKHITISHKKKEIADIKLDHHEISVKKMSAEKNYFKGQTYDFFIAIDFFNFNSNWFKLFKIISNEINYDYFITTETQGTWQKVFCNSKPQNEIVDYLKKIIHLSDYFDKLLENEDVEKIFDEIIHQKPYNILELIQTISDQDQRRIFTMTYKNKKKVEEKDLKKWVDRNIFSKFENIKKYLENEKENKNKDKSQCENKGETKKYEFEVSFQFFIIEIEKNDDGSVDTDKLENHFIGNIKRKDFYQHQLFIRLPVNLKIVILLKIIKKYLPKEQLDIIDIFSVLSGNYFHTKNERFGLFFSFNYEDNENNNSITDLLKYTLAVIFLKKKFFEQIEDLNKLSEEKLFTSILENNIIQDVSPINKKRIYFFYKDNNSNYEEIKEFFDYYPVFESYEDMGLGTIENDLLENLKNDDYDKEYLYDFKKVRKYLRDIKINKNEIKENIENKKKNYELLRNLRFSVNNKIIGDKIYIFYPYIHFNTKNKAEILYSFWFYVEKENFIKSEKLNKIIKLIRYIEVPLKIFYENLKDKLLEDYINKFKKNKLKSAITSILVDSYAHNISAHSLAALKWWFDIRTAEYDKKFNITNDECSLHNLKPADICNSNLKKYSNMVDIYNEILGVEFQNNGVSIMDIVRFLSGEDNENLLAYEGPPEDETINNKFRYPVPIDFALSNFFRFLRDKAAFWSGVTRDMSFGGESKNLYDILWNDFANNPLYLGTIAHSEGINKLNLYIELPCENDECLNGAISFNKDKENTNYKRYHFAIINMNVMSYEEDEWDGKSSSHNGNEIKYKTDNEELEIDYSNYALIYPARDHNDLREKLNKRDYKIFLPGGIVGEQALFTIFENTIRNIKHFDIHRIKDENANWDGLNFNIRITPTKLMPEPEERKNEISVLGSENHKLFKIGVYLDHPNNYIYFDNENEKLTRLKNKLEKNTKKSILTENYSPRLGGSSQDKICAAMLFNNEFMSVDPEIKGEKSKRDDYYYNDKANFFWIGFDDSCDEEEYEKIKKNEEKNKKLNELNEQCRVLKYFNLWKADFIYYSNDFNNIENENVSRFKFVLVENDISSEEVVKLRENGVIRILYENDFCGHVDLLKTIKESQELSDEDKVKIYKIWLDKFVEKKSYKFFPCYNQDHNHPNSKLSINEDYSIGTLDNKSNGDICFYIHHSGNTYEMKEKDIMFYRSHGWLRKNIVKNNNFNLDNDITSDSKFFQFIETLSTKILIIDNRVYERFDNTLRVKFSNKFNLEIYEEFNKKENNDWKTIKCKVKKDNYNFVVLHLSFIESLGYDEEKINEFFKKEITKNKFKEMKTIFVITTGRGRSIWIEELDDIYKKKTIYKPIEAILNAVENGVIMKDDFQVKHNLAKVLFGS